MSFKLLRRWLWHLLAARGWGDAETSTTPLLDAIAITIVVGRTVLNSFVGFIAARESQAISVTGTILQFIIIIVVVVVSAIMGVTIIMLLLL